MEDNKALLEALNGIRQEISQLNKTVAALAAARSSEYKAPAPGKPFEGRPSRPTGARGRIAGGYKRPATDDGDGGFGSESRFSKPKRSSGGFKGKGPAKKGGSGYPKKKPR